MPGPLGGINRPPREETTPATHRDSEVIGVCSQMTRPGGEEDRAVLTTWDDRNGSVEAKPSDGQLGRRQDAGLLVCWSGLGGGCFHP